MTTTEPTRSTDALLVAQLLAAEKGGGQADGTLIANLVDCLMETDPPLWTEPHLRGLWQRHPASDGLRLLYAEWCDRATKQCGACRGKGYDEQIDWPASNGCMTCSGTGTVPDTSARNRAELIRVQVELERIPPCPTPHTGPMTADHAKALLAWQRQHHGRFGQLHLRERDLIAAHPEWLTLRCGACEGRGRTYVKTATGETPVGSACLTCGGTGDLLASRTVNGGTADGRRPVTWDRGWLVVECDSGDVWREDWVPCCRDPLYPSYGNEQTPCVRCGTTVAARQVRLVPTPWAAAISREVAGLRLRDFPPVLHATGKWGFTTTDILAMPIPVRKDVEVSEEVNAAADAAVQALAWAVAGWARGQSHAN